MSFFRNLLIERKRKPYYCEVEYLESTGTQYIDTGFVFSDTSHTYKWDIGAQAVNTGNTNYNWFCGLFENGAYSAGTYADNTTNYKFYAVGTYYQNGQVITNPLSNGDKYGIIRNVFTITNYVGTLPVVLFGRNVSSGIKCDATKKIFYYKIWDNDTLVRDMIPVLDWNMTPCMYDKISGQLFYNKGTGSFSYGREIHYVDYLESTGTQYIDTGVTIDNTSGYDVKWMALNADDRIIMGTKGAGDSRWVLSGNNNPNINLSWNMNYGRAGLGLNKIQTAQMNYLNDRKRILNGIQITDISEILSADASTYNVCIFGGYWGSSSVSLFSTCRIYYAKITKGTEVIRDYLPAIDENGVSFMFDRVTHTIFDNAGTGNFNYPLVELDYLESTTNNNLIYTGLNYFADYEVGIKLRNNVANKALGNGTANCMERKNAIDHTWRFSSNGSYDSNIDILEYHVIKWKEDKIYADDVLIAEKVKNKGTAQMSLFGAGSYFPNMIYFCKLWNPDDGVLMRDYIPVFYNGEAGMWDKANSVFYPNAGSGTLVGGPVIESKWF